LILSVGLLLSKYKYATRTAFLFLLFSDSAEVLLP